LSWSHGAFEFIDLDAADRIQLIEEAARAARFLKAHAGAHKINIGALGNIVRQLHLHVVARTIGDPAWPGPVLGAWLDDALWPGGSECVDSGGQDKSRDIAAVLKDPFAMELIDGRQEYREERRIILVIRTAAFRQWPTP
jgi:diadenosine tetraphosphate (Ap4A) HIT family hydrolase